MEYIKQNNGMIGTFNLTYTHTDFLGNVVYSGIYDHRPQRPENVKYVYNPETIYDPQKDMTLGKLINPPLDYNKNKL